MSKGSPAIERGRSATVGPADQAMVIPGVQGIASSLDDVTLNGRRISAEVSGALEDGTLERTIEGASSLTLDINDDHNILLDSPLLAEGFDIALDGLFFRFVKASKTGLSEPLGLTAEDLDVARLRVPHGARKAVRGKVTRAEFARRLVREVKPPIPFYSPQLHKSQPIATAAAARADSAGRLARREPGLPTNAKITVKHAQATAVQIRTIGRALDTASSLNASEQAMIAVVMCLTQENEAKGPNPFQQNADWPGDPNDVENATTNFLKRAPTYPGGLLGYLRRHQGSDLGAAIQAVQRSSFPRAYSQWEGEARATVRAYLGGAGARASAATQAQTTGKYQFERKPEESTWDCTGRLAEEVQWRRFVSAGIFYFLAETHMLQSKRRALISPSAPGVEDISLDYDSGKPITEITVSARARAWGAPPGTAAEVEGCGPANGIFIVSKISAPLRRANSLCDITLKRPSDPLPEPAPKAKKAKGGKRQVRSASAGAQDDFAGRVKQAIDRIEALHLSYRWGGGHGSSPAPANGPFDCSSFVCRVLQEAGLDISTMVSGALASWGDPGEGNEVTVYANAEHTFIAVRVNGEWRYAGTSATNPGHGPGWISTPSASYRAGFRKRHPRGH